MYLLSALHHRRVVVVSAGLWPCHRCRCRCAAVALATGVTSLLSSSLAMVLSSSLSVVPPWSMPGGGGGGGGGVVMVVVVEAGGGSGDASANSHLTFGTFWNPFMAFRTFSTWHAFANATLPVESKISSTALQKSKKSKKVSEVCHDLRGH